MYSEEEKHGVWRKAKPAKCTTRLPWRDSDQLRVLSSPERRQEGEAEVAASQCKKQNSLWENHVVYRLTASLMCCSCTHRKFILKKTAVLMRDRFLGEGISQCMLGRVNLLNS